MIGAKAAIWLSGFILVGLSQSASALGKPHDDPPASEGAPAAAADSSCEDGRVAFRMQVSKLLKLPVQSKFTYITFRHLRTKYCSRNLTAPANMEGSTTALGQCEMTYRKIVANIGIADSTVRLGCEKIAQAKAKSKECLKGNETCQRLVASTYREASELMGKGEKSAEKGIKLIEEQLKKNASVARRYASHLVTIANVIEQHDRFQAMQKRMAPMSFVPQSAKQRKREINEEAMRLMNLQAQRTEGSPTVEAMLSEAGLDMENTKKIRERASDIQFASERSTSLGGDVDYMQRFGPLPGEQLNTLHIGGSFLPMANEARAELAASSKSLAEAAFKVETSLGNAGSVSQAPPPVSSNVALKPSAGGGSVGPSLPQASAGQDSSSSSLPLLMGASRVLASAAGQPQGLAAPSGPLASYSAAAEPRENSKRSLGLAPGEYSRLAKDTGRKLSEREKEQEEIQAVAQFRQEIDLPAEEVSRAGSTALPGGFRASAATASLSSGGGWNDLDLRASDPKPTGVSASSSSEVGNKNALAFADRQVARLEQGRRFSPSMRDRLRRRLASEYQSGQGKTRAAADLFEDMKRNEFLSGDEVTGEEQMGILSSQSESLFARVQSAHRRSVEKARVAFH